MKLARLYEYEDQHGNVYWTFKEPTASVESTMRLRIRNRNGIHALNFIDKIRSAARNAKNWLAS